MNYKITALFIIAAIIASIVYFINPFAETEAKRVAQPWFYQLSNDEKEFTNRVSSTLDVQLYSIRQELASLEASNPVIVNED